ncbi:MAG: molecular chaperone TorD family protein, partial [Gemmatimonadota bacterium]
MAASRNGQLIHRQPRRRQTRRGRSIPTLELAGFREAAYRLFSQALLYPAGERLAALATATKELAQDDHVAAQFAFYGDWRRVLALVGGVGAPRLDLEEQHVALFGASRAGPLCPPYESAFLSPSGQLDGLQLARVEAAYSVIGLVPSPDLGELPDHVAIELEFMAMLCGQEAVAWEAEDTPNAVKAMRRAKRFLDGHLSVWLPAFARRLAATDKDGFYRTVSEGAAAFVLYDRDLLAAFVDGLSRLSK